MAVLPFWEIIRAIQTGIKEILKGRREYVFSQKNQFEQLTLAI